MGNSHIAIIKFLSLNFFEKILSTLSSAYAFQILLSNSSLFFPISVIASKLCRSETCAVYYFHKNKYK